MKTLLLTGWLLITGVLVAQEGVRRIDRTDEKEVKIRLTYAAGQIKVGRVEADALAEVIASRSTLRPSVKYTKSRETGYLDIDIADGDDVGMAEFGEQDWFVGVTERIPTTLKCDFGACRGDLDLSGLRLQNLDISVGASKMLVRFDTPNRETMHTMKIEAGASNMRLVGLANSNAKRIEFEGGIGSFLLDFSGYLQSSMTAKISLGVGKANIRIPQDTNVRIRLTDNIFSVCSIESRDFDRRSDNVYVSKSFNDQAPILDIELEAGFGKFKIDVDR